MRWQCWPGGSICLPYLYVLWSQWQYWTLNRSLCALSVLPGGCPSAFGVCTIIYALVFPYIFLLNSEEITLSYDSVDWGSLSAFESQWYQWTMNRSLCAQAVLTGGFICLWCLYLYICTCISLYFLIEQWIDHSRLWQCWPGWSVCLWCLYLYICTGISLYFLIE